MKKQDRRKVKKITELRQKKSDRYLHVQHHASVDARQKKQHALGNDD